MKNNLFLLVVSLFSAAIASAQTDSTKPKNHSYCFGFIVPTITYTAQRNNFSTTIPSDRIDFRFQPILRTVNYELLRFRFIYKKQFSIGAQLFFSNNKNKSTMLENIAENHPNQHITNFRQEGLNITTPRFSAGYRYPFFKSERKTKYVGLNCYYNFDFFNFGNYRYDAKNVSDNSFYSYTLQSSRTDEFWKKHSFTYEIERGTTFYNKEWNRYLLVACKLGLTIRNQSVQFTETIKTFDAFYENELAPVNFKSWSVNFGVFLSAEKPIERKK